MEEQFSALSRVGDDCYYTTVFLLESSHAVLGCGQLFGGVAVLWRNGLQRVVRALKSGSDRVHYCMCPKFGADTDIFLVVSVYMPCECVDSMEAYEEKVGCIESIMQDDSCAAV